MQQNYKLFYDKQVFNVSPDGQWSRPAKADSGRGATDMWVDEQTLK